MPQCRKILQVDLLNKPAGKSGQRTGESSARPCGTMGAFGWVQGGVGS